MRKPAKRGSLVSSASLRHSFRLKGVGHDVVGFEIRVLVGKGCRPGAPQITGETTHSQVHLGQLCKWCWSALAVDGDILALALMAFDKLEGLHEHTA